LRATFATSRFSLRRSVVEYRRDEP
jgi:hypothetical protein